MNKEKEETPKKEREDTKKDRDETKKDRDETKKDRDDLKKEKHAKPEKPPESIGKSMQDFGTKLGKSVVQGTKVSLLLQKVGLTQSPKKEEKEEKKEDKREDKKEDKKEDKREDKKKDKKKDNDDTKKRRKSSKKNRSKSKGKKKEKKEKDCDHHHHEKKKDREEKEEEKREKKEPKDEKEKTDKEKKAPELAATQEAESFPQPDPAHLLKWLQRALHMGVEKLRAEYRSLSQYTHPEMNLDAFKANPTKNRYQDVPCQEQNRVILTYPGATTNYIHANYVATPQNEKRFICTQGPLDSTVTEFWQMVMQEGSETIVMLCNCVELNKIKCAEYWPKVQGEVKKIDGAEIEVKNNGSKPIENEQTIVLTQLEIKSTTPSGTETREIRHYHWQDWPDRGVPPCKLTSLALLSFVRGNKKPIVVHCSAGIGRTGTIVAIEYIMQKLMAGKECIDLEVSFQQYLYIHRIILCYFLEKYSSKFEAILTEENTAKYKKFDDDYNAATTV